MPLGKTELIVMMAITSSGIIIGFIQRKAVYSRIYFDENGITNVCFCSKNIFLPWSECKEIGICNKNLYGYQHFIFFTSVQLGASKKELLKAVRIPNDNALRVEYSEAVIGEIEKYVGKDKILERHFY